jgi:ribulose-phosphate 3-epimerase
VINEIHAHGMRAGLAISPQTPASKITDEAFAAADMILVMTVHPGKGGQKFMPECLEKVKQLRERFGWEKDVQVDGGVGPGNICQCAQAGTFGFYSLPLCVGKSG